MNMNNGMETATSESEEYITAYPASDKQYDGAKRYTSYESIQTGAMGKSAK